MVTWKRNFRRGAALAVAALLLALSPARAVTVEIISEDSGKASLTEGNGTDLTVTVSSGYLDVDVQNDINIRSGQGSVNIFTKDDGDINLYGDTNVYGNVSGYNGKFEGQLTVDGDFKVGSNSYLRNTEINGDLTVNSTARFNDLVEMYGGLEVYDDLIVKGETIFKENAQFEGQARFNELVEMYGGLEVQGNSTFNDNLKVVGDTVLGTSPDDTLLVNSQAMFESEARFKELVEMYDGLKVQGASTFDSVTVDNNLTVTGNTYLRDTYVAGDIYMDGGKITGLGRGEISATSTDAITGAQLYEVRNSLTSDIKKVGSHAAALAGLKPLDYDPDAPFSVNFAVGSYRGETTVAVGANHYFSNDAMLNAGVTLGDDHNMLTAGMSFRIGKGSGGRIKKTAQMLKEKDAQIRQLQNQIKAMEQRQEELEKAVNQRQEALEDVIKMIVMMKK